MNEPRKKRLTMDEIMEEISSYAQDPEAGADRFRALKFLASIESAGIVLPVPRKEAELEEAMARLMIGAGVSMTQAAYIRAFPNAKRAIYAGKKLLYTEATPEMKQQALRCTSLSVYHEMFPEMKSRRGTPKGYPLGASSMKKMEWCQTEALRILVERERANRQAGHDAMKTGGTETAGATEGSPDGDGEEAEGLAPPAGDQAEAPVQEHTL